MERTNEIEAMVDPSHETIWATQKAIAGLFKVTVPNISYHLKKIFQSGELDKDMVIKEILITAQSGARGLSDDKLLYYNLDAIISVDTESTPFKRLNSEYGRRALSRNT